MMNNIPILCSPSKITKVGEECVILPNDVTENCTVGLANETATFIMDRIDGFNSIDKIAEDMCEIYDIKKQDADNVILDFVLMLIEKGLCKWKIAD